MTYVYRVKIIERDTIDGESYSKTHGGGDPKFCVGVYSSRKLAIDSINIYYGGNIKLYIGDDMQVYPQFQIQEYLLNNGRA